MKVWQARLVGFATPWWFVMLALSGVGEARRAAGLVALGVGVLWALWTMASGQEGSARQAAIWFVLGVVALLSFLMLAVALLQFGGLGD